MQPVILYIEFRDGNNIGFEKRSSSIHLAIVNLVTINTE